MLLRRRAAATFALILLVVSVAPAQEARLQQIEQYVQKSMEEWKVPGVAVAIVKDDKVVFAKGFGTRELGTNKPVDENTVFAIASNSKAFCAAALALLVDEGKLKWDDRVTKYLPGLQMSDPYVTREMTIRDLLSHRAGLRTFAGDLLWYEANYPREEVVRRIRFLTPSHGFREKYGYSNLMFTAAGEVVEAVTGKSYDDFLRERILQPLGMKRTLTSVRAFEKMDNVSRPHNESTGKLRPLPYGNVDGGGAGINVNSSVGDLAQWVRLQLGRGKYEGKQIFSPAASREMWQPAIFQKISEEAEKFIPSRHFSLYGLGWGLSDYQGRKIVSHTGALDGFFSGTTLVPEENLGVVVLTNSETPFMNVIWRKVVDVYIGAPARDWSAETLKQVHEADQKEAEEEKDRTKRIEGTKPSLAPAGYTGTYRSEMYGDVAVADEGGKLVLRMAPAPRLVADLEHWHYDTFLVRWRESAPYNFKQKGFATFVLDNQGKAAGLKIDQPNPDFHFFELGELKRVEKK